MHVIATAGHVDHGKSTLVRALTGQEPDRWAEERARGLTIDLGFAWTQLPSGKLLAFVDVPGHQRFIANMLAGIGPVAAVMFVVAADEGWCRQSTEHLAAITALGIRHGVLVVTRSDLCPPEDALGQARRQLADSPLAGCAELVVSGTTMAGLDELRDALDRLTATLPAPDPRARVRLWVDRVFSIRGSGTVVTGTLAAGTLRVGEQLEIGGTLTRIRGLQALETEQEWVPAPARVAVNLRNVDVEDLHRGDALLTPGAWREVYQVDARLDPPLDSPPGQVMVHVGTAGVPGRLRPLGVDTVRLGLERALPLQTGDRLILRDPGAQQVLAGALVLDADPPPLVRRGAARRRAIELETATGVLDPITEVNRRGHVRRLDLLSLGATEAMLADLAGVHRVGEWLISAELWQRWVRDLGVAVKMHARRYPLEPRISLTAAQHQLGLPDRTVLLALADAAALRPDDGYLLHPGSRPSLGAAEAALREIERALGEHPFAAPEREELERAGLGSREIAAAVRLGRLINLGDLVVLGPRAPAQAMRILTGLRQPFTTSEARQALKTTRRVVIPLLEHLDRRGWTRRLDAGHREVVR